MNISTTIKTALFAAIVASSSICSATPASAAASRIEASRPLSFAESQLLARWAGAQRFAMDLAASCLAAHPSGSERLAKCMAKDPDAAARSAMIAQPSAAIERSLHAQRGASADAAFLKAYLTAQSMEEADANGSAAESAVAWAIAAQSGDPYDKQRSAAFATHVVKTAQAAAKTRALEALATLDWENASKTCLRQLETATGLSMARQLVSGPIQFKSANSIFNEANDRLGGYEINAIDKAAAMAFIDDAGFLCGEDAR